MSGALGRGKAWLAFVMFMGLLLGLLVQSAVAEESAAAVAPSGVVPRAAASATDSTPSVLVSSEGDVSTSEVPAAAVAKCKTLRTKTRKTVRKREYKKLLRKINAKKKKGKLSAKQYRKAKKKARKTALKRAKKAAKKKYATCLNDSRVVTIRNVEWVQRSAGSDVSLVPLGDGTVLKELGDKPKGRISGVTAAGAPFDVPASFSDFAVAPGGKLSMTVSVAAGAVPEKVRDRSDLKNVDTSAAAPVFNDAASWKQVSVLVQPASAKTWSWSGTGAGTVTRSGNSFTATLTGSDAGAGVQPAGVPAQMAWADVAKNWATMTSEGVKPRLTLWGADAAGDTRGAILSADSVVFDPKAGLTVSGTASPAGADPALDAVLPSGGQAALSVTLETANMGKLTKYVVIAGDSYASGEGAQYAGTYMNPEFGQVWNGSTVINAALLDAFRNDWANLYRRFCDGVDLSCEKAVTDNKNQVRYVTDPGKVYEKGTWERVDEGLACHRSYVAPGSWLARYFKKQGEDVDWINLACTGAETPDIIDRKFKGQQPQSEELKQIAAWLPIAYVTGSIGGNDIGFQEVGTKCVLAPINAIDPNLLTGGGADFDAQALLGKLTNIFDDVVRDADGNVVSLNPWFKPETLCSEQERQRMRKRIAEVRGKIAAAVAALHAAAPDAQIVWNNYPTVVPPSSKTYFPRQEWFPFVRKYTFALGPDWPNPAPNPNIDYWQKYLVDRGPDFWPDGKVITPAEQVARGGNPTDADEFVKGLLAGNRVNEVIAKHAYRTNEKELPDGTKSAGTTAILYQIVGEWTQYNQSLLDILSLGAIMFGYDQDWAAQEVLPGLNKAVLAALRDVDPNGEFTTPVDMTQVFNGRELGTKFALSKSRLHPIGEPDGDEMGPSIAFMTDEKYTDHGKNGTSEAPGPASGVRANFVTGLWQGQTIGALCPEDRNGDSKCFGETQEALHPNWRGQAAMGQCIVAVATGAFGEGNACVRSVGPDNGADERKYLGGDQYGFQDMHDVTLWSVVKPDADPAAPYDRLCLTPIPDTYDTEQGKYAQCTSDVDADPTWAADTWESGKVRWPDGKGGYTKSAWR